MKESPEVAVLRGFRLGGCAVAGIGAEEEMQRRGCRERTWSASAFCEYWAESVSYTSTLSFSLSISLSRAGERFWIWSKRMMIRVNTASGLQQYRLR